MNVLKLIMSIAVLLIEIVLVISIMLQSGNKSGVSAMSGVAETYFTKGRNKGREEKLATITKVLVFILLALVIALVIMK